MRAITVVKKPPMPPHVCFKCKCGEHAREFFVDIGADTEFDGTIYLCDSCMEDLGRSTEMFFSKEVFEDKIALYQMELATLQNAYLEFLRIKDIWSQHYPMTLIDYANTLEKVLNGTNGNSVDATGESEPSGESNFIGNNVIQLVPDSSDSSGSDEESSGQTITAPVIPLFS